MPVEFRLLGPLEVTEHDRPLEIGGGKQRSLLAVLLLHANEVVSTDQLIDALWGESAPATVAKSIQVYVSRLRKQLGDGPLVTRPPGYLLRVDPSELDIARFEQLVAEAGSADPETAARKLRQALALWRGPPLADLAYEPFAQSEIARLEELRLGALEQRIDAELATGRHAELVGQLEALAKQHPQRERLSAQLMLCLYRCGRQAEALETYQSARRALVDDLGIEPGRPLRELHRAILLQDPALDPPSRRSPDRPTQPQLGAFVGREDELAELDGGLDAAFEGHGRLFLLAGDPGIGKSRLTEELMAHATARGAHVLVGRCWEAGGAPAYWPWVQSLRAYVRDGDAAALRSQLPSGAAQLAQIVPDLRLHFPELGSPAQLEPEAARFELFDATAEFLRRASQARPIVLVLDDLHAADAPSLLLLQFVARELGSSRMLVLGAYRDVDPVPGGPLLQTLAELAREPVTRRLSLAGLSRRELAEYVELTASPLASPGLVGALHEDTNGNPLFVTEIVRLLSVEGVTDESRLAIPQTVRDVISRRLTHLSAECNRVLLLASVLGREFELDTLALLDDAPGDEMLETLDEALAARVITDSPGNPGRLRFAHVLIRDTLYDGLTSVRRVRLHRQVVDAIEARHGDELGPHLAELAHHATAGRNAGKGLDYARRAGDRALALLAYEEAARLYGTAIATLRPDDRADDRTRCELLLTIADATSRAGNASGSRSALLEAAGIARRLGLPRQLASAAAEYGGRIVYARAGDDRWVLPLLEEALAALPDDELELRSGLLARLSAALRDEPSRTRRDALSREAVDLARRSGDPAALAYALDGRAIAILAPDTVTEVLVAGGELLEVAERIGDRERVVHAHMHRLGPQLMLGDVDGARAGLDAASRIADALRQPAHLWDVGAAHAMLALATGSMRQAEELVEWAFALGERAQPEMVVPVYRLQRHTLCDFRGGLEEIEPAIRELVAERPARPVFRCVLAHIHMRLGLPAHARPALEELTADDCAALPVDSEWLFGMSLLAEVSSALGDSGSASVVYALLSPWAALNVVDQCEGIRGSVARYLGLLATTTGRLDQAERHFEDALALNARMGVRPWLAHTQHDYAHMLLDRGGGGDRERARQLAGAALATYRELGMEPPPSA